MLYRDYAVDSAFVDGHKIRWKTTGNGEFIIGKKLGEKFFIKRNIHVRYPSKDLPKIVYQQYLKVANGLEFKQEELRKLMKKIDWEADHILVEERNFWDNENMFTTVTHYISDSLPSDFDYSNLAFKEFSSLALEIAKLIKKVNDCKVIHGDIKEKNLLVRQIDGVYIPYLVDFDSSFACRSIPDFDNIGGTDGYQSPEVIQYIVEEDEKLRENITTKIDVFSLGVLFHHMWTNTFPVAEADRCSVGEALLLDKEISFNRKFEIEIGPRYHTTFVSLINWMLEKDFNSRASIEDVILVLSDEQGVDERYYVKSDYQPFDNELWEVHSCFAALCVEEKLLEMGVTSLKKYNDGCGSAGLKYCVTKDKIEKILDIKELIKIGYAQLLPVSIVEPWPEHKIKFISSEALFSKGYFKIDRINQMGNHRYTVTELNGREIDTGYEWLVSNGLANFVRLNIKSDTPWPEHGGEYIMACLEKMRVKRISRVDIGGEHRYKIVYYDKEHGKNKISDKVSVNNMRLMGLIK